MFANRCCESLSYLVLTLAAQNGAGLSKVDLTVIEGRLIVTRALGGTVL